MAPSEIAELRDFISGELRKVHTRFDGMDGRFDGIDGRLDGIDGRLDGMDGRFDGIDGRLDGIDGRLDGIDGRLDGIDGRLDGLDGAVAELREKVEEVHFEQHAFQSHVAHHFGAVYGRLDDVSARLSRMEVWGEEMKSDFRAFGEALQVTNRRIDEFRLDVERELRDVRAEMRGDSPPWGSV
jgi:archaellum component FlaC